MRGPARQALLWLCLPYLLWQLSQGFGHAAARPAPLLLLPSPGEIPAYEPPPAGEEPAPPPLDPRPRFLDNAETDDEILARLCTLPLKSLVPLGGGASISLKATLQDGSLAAVKPEQSHVTRHYAEVAAYRVARALRLGKVAPSCVRKLPREALFHPGMGKTLLARMEEEVRVDARGQVACAFIHWVPKLKGLGLEKQAWWQPLLRRGAPLPREPEKRRRLLDISTLLLFDFLIINDDRWSGGNTHTSEGRMMFLDQGAGFGRDGRGRRAYAMTQLRWSQRFDREVAQALFELDVPALQRELRPLLSPAELTELAERIDEARRYLRRLEAEAPKDSLL